MVQPPKLEEVIKELESQLHAVRKELAAKVFGGYRELKYFHFTPPQSNDGWLHTYTKYANTHRDCVISNTHAHKILRRLSSSKGRKACCPQPNRGRLQQRKRHGSRPPHSRSAVHVRPVIDRRPVYNEWKKPNVWWPL